jgi:hypothetical protein
MIGAASVAAIVSKPRCHLHPKPQRHHQSWLSYSLQKAGAGFPGLRLKNSRLNLLNIPSTAGWPIYSHQDATITLVIIIAIPLVKR